MKTIEKVINLMLYAFFGTTVLASFAAVSFVVLSLFRDPDTCYHAAVICGGLAMVSFAISWVLTGITKLIEEVALRY